MDRKTKNHGLLFHQLATFWNKHQEEFMDYPLLWQLIERYHALSADYMALMAQVFHNCKPVRNSANSSAVRAGAPYLHLQEVVRALLHQQNRRDDAKQLKLSAWMIARRNHKLVAEAVNNLLALGQMERHRLEKLPGAEELLNHCQSNREEFLGYITQPATRVKLHAEAKAKQEALRKEIMSLLVDRLDGLMRLFAHSDPALYNHYQTARRMPKHNGGRKRKKKVVVQPKPLVEQVAAVLQLPMPLPAVTLEADWQEVPLKQQNV